MPTQITKFVAANGKEFLTLEAAEFEELKCQIVQMIENNTHCRGAAEFMIDDFIADLRLDSGLAHTFIHFIREALK